MQLRFFQYLSVLLNTARLAKARAARACNAAGRAAALKAFNTTLGELCDAVREIAMAAEEQHSRPTRVWEICPLPTQ